MQKPFPGYEFSTYNEFFRILNSMKRISIKRKLQWAESLSKEQLLLRGDERPDLTVAQVLAFSRCLPEKHVFLPGEEPDEDILMLKNRHGFRVVHELADKHCFPNRLIVSPDGEVIPKFLMVAEGLHGDTTAHILASHGTLPEKCMTADIMSLKNDAGYTVFDILLQAKNFPPEKITPEIAVLKPRTLMGQTVIRRFARDLLLEWTVPHNKYPKDRYPHKESYAKEQMDRLPYETKKILRQQFESMKMDLPKDRIPRVGDEMEQRWLAVLLNLLAQSLADDDRIFAAELLSEDPGEITECIESLYSPRQ